MDLEIAVLLATLGILVTLIIVVFFKLSQMQSRIDSSISKTIADYIDKMIASMSSLKEDYGQITSKLLTLSEISNDTKTLKSYLTNPKVRGRWGERLVEDIINLVGLQENINYLKQKAIESGRPDFTFNLPNGKRINLDAKFSLDNYMRFVESQNDIERNRYRDEFLKDVKKTIKDVSCREYINEDTVDFAILFIASEAVYSFLLSEQPEIVDFALKNRVVLCSPVNLYAMLSVVRKAMDYFVLEQTAKQVLEFMEKFYKEWSNYKEKFEKIGKLLDSLRENYNELVITRKDKLDSVLSSVDKLLRDSQQAAVEEIEDRKSD